MYTRWIRNFAFSLNPCNVASVSSFCVAPRIPQIPVHQYSVVKPLVPVRYAHNSEFDEPDEHFDLSRPGRDLLHPSTLVGARNILYSSCTDPVVEELRKCQKHEDLVRIFKDASRTPTPQQIVQAILSTMEIDEKPPDQEFLEDLLADLAKVKDQLSLNELSLSLLCLAKPLNTSQSLRCLVGDILERARDEETWDLPTLSRLTVILNTLRDIPYFYTYPIVLPRIEAHLKRNNLTQEDLIHLTVAMKHFTRYLSADVMDLYRYRVKQLEWSASFSSSSSQSNILKICHLLNSSSWSTENASLIRKLMRHVDAKQLDLPDLSVAFKITQSQLEPRPLISSILERAIELRNEDHPVNPLLLHCEVIQTLPAARRQLVDTVELYLTQQRAIMSTEDVLILFKILRQAKVSKSRLCNVYWNKVLEKIRAEPAEQQSDRLIHHCHRYMYFNNNLGGTYRYFAFERFVLELILVELREGVSRLVPAKLARLSSFLVGYGTSEQIPQLILDQLLSCRDQLSFSDCLQLSRGIQIALELRFRRGIPHTFARQLQSLEKTIDDAIAGKLREREMITITEANVILRGLAMQRSTRNVEIWQRLVQRFDLVDFEITSRIIRDTTMNLTIARIKTPTLFEAFLDYLVKRQQVITGDIVEKVLHSCYTIGHDTNNREALRVGAEIVERDFELMTGLAIVNSCLALCFYGGLSRQLVAKVFCIEFIKRLEDEIKMCYSKATYPQKVLNKVMQLNRSVCLDHPEYSVPWFQQNYVEAQTTKSSPNEVFQQDVLHRIRQIFRDDVDKFELNHSTAYGYRLDFLVKVGEGGKLLPKETERCSRRLAVILLGVNSFCSNDDTHLCGYEQLRQRHLEILGFEVLEISYRDWATAKFNVDTLRELFIQRNIEIVQ